MRKTIVPGRLVIAMVLAGVGLVAATPSASAASPPGGTPVTAALAFDVNGHWTDNGTAKPVITSVGSAVVIDMSYAHRPSATGAVIDTRSILVTFPDAGTLIGTFGGPTVLQWSNGSIWQKVYTGPMVIDLNDNWTQGPTDQHISEVGGYIKIEMSALHRPNAPGFAVSPDFFMINFPDDRNTTFGTLVPGNPDRITWSNGSQWWREPPPAPPGNPECLRPGILC
jgi:hypothetical protein